MPLILSIDDSPLIHSRIAEFVRKLEVKGLEVEFGNDGLEALNLVRQYNPDILLLDHNMPYIEGCDLIESMQSQNPELFIVICSSDNDAIMRAVEMDVQGYILKPFNYEDFEKVIRRALEEIA